MEGLWDPYSTGVIFLIRNVMALEEWRNLLPSANDAALVPGDARTLEAPEKKKKKKDTHD